MKDIRIIMYTYNTTYVPCVFCHTTVPAEQMASHLAQCQHAGATVVQGPYGTTQSVQYRRVVRVERKTVDDRNITPIPFQQGYSTPMVQGTSLPAVSPQYMLPNQSYADKPLPLPPTGYSTSQQSYAQTVLQGQGRYTQQPVQQNIYPSVPRPIQQQSVQQQSVQQQPIQQVRMVQQTVQRSVQQPRPVQQPKQVQQPRQVQQPVQHTIQQPIQQSRPVQQPVQQRQVQQSKQVQQSRMVQQSVQQSRPIQQPRQVQQPIQQPIQQANRYQKPQQAVQQPRQTPQQTQLQSQPKPIQQSTPLQSQKPAQQQKPVIQRPPEDGKVEVLDPGSLSDRIRMFEAKSTSIPPSIPMPETRTYTETASEDTFVPDIEVPEPMTVSQRKAALEKQMAPSASKPLPKAPQQRQSVPVPIQQQQRSQPIIQQQCQSTPISQQQRQQSPSSVSKPALPPQHQPGKLSIPATIPGQLSLEEMLEKKKREGLRERTPPVQPQEPVVQPQSVQSNSQPVQPSLQPIQSLQQPQTQQFQSQQIVTHSSSQPGKLTIPPSVPGQLSLEQMLLKKQTQGLQPSSMTMERQEYHETTQSTTTSFVTQQQYVQQSASVEVTDNPVITFEDKEMQDMQEPECQSLYTANGVFVSLLCKEDMKMVFSSDAVLSLSGFSDAVVCVYSTQICIYQYSEEIKDYQLIVCLYPVVTL